MKIIEKLQEIYKYCTKEQLTNSKGEDEGFTQPTNESDVEEVEFQL
jgi:hypothetical protein